MGISPFASKLFKSILSAVCHTSVLTISFRIWCSFKHLLVWWFFFLLFNLLLDCEFVLLREVRKLINLESANFKLDPELSSLNDHTFIPCSDQLSLKKMKTPKWIEKKSTRMGEKKKEEKMGMSTITKQSNHQRKERKTSQNQSLRLKSLPLRKKRFVSLLITILYCSKINQYY